MKKQLSTLICSFAVLAAGAITVKPADSSRLITPMQSELRASSVTPAPVNKAITSRAGENEDEVYYTLAGEPASAYGLSSQAPGTQIAMAFQIEPSFLANLSDAQITEISYYTGTQSNEEINKITEATVFIAEALDGKYLYTQVTSAPETPFTKVDVILDEPFTIPADKKIYVGVFFKLNSVDNASIVVDGKGHATDKGGWVGVRRSALSKWTWDNYSDEIGFVTLGAKIKSTDLPKNSVAVVAADGMPVVKQNNPFDAECLIQNNGINAINAITFEYGLEGQVTKTETVTLNKPWNFNQTLYFIFDEIVPQEASKLTSMTIKVSEIDGAQNLSDEATGSYSMTVVPENSNLKQNVVIEEFTSIKCIWCPVGYTAMETIHEETDGRIIPVCVHANVSGTDPMTATSYNNVFQNYANGAPSSTVNRKYSVYPYYSSLMECANSLLSLPAIASVEADATLDAENRELVINTKTQFAFDYEDAADNFILSFGITENEVGPYAQSNGYSGTGQNVLGDWSDKPSTVQLVYNDVARQLDRFSGVRGSIPAEVTANEVYEYTHTMTAVQVINDLNNINVVVYLTDKTTGEIVNACRLTKNGDGTLSGIEDVITDNCDNELPVEYYNIQGVRVAEPTNGLYIRKQGSNVSKIIF